MDSNSQIAGITTRQSVRRFGINLTNHPLPPRDSLSKPRRNGCLTNNSPNQWLKLHPEIAPYYPEIIARNTLTHNTTYINDNYMLWHSDISVVLREELVGWLVSLQHRMRLTPTTLYFAVNLIDRYCYEKFISQERYQLLGVTCLFVAAKYQEIKTPRLRRYVQVVVDVYQEQEILDMEGEILILLGFNLKVMTVVEWLEQEMTLMGFDENSKQMARYVLDLTLLEFWSCLVKPSVMVWAILAITAQAKGMRVEGCVDVEEGRQALKLVNLTYMKRQEGKYKEVNGKYQEYQNKGSSQ